MVAGIWSAFIGWFPGSAAARPGEQVAMHEALAGVTVSRIMRRTRSVVSPLAASASDRDAGVDPLDDAADVLRRMRERDVDRLHVVEGAHLAGVIERADIERWITAHVDETAAVAA